MNIKAACAVNSTATAEFPANPWAEILAGNVAIHDLTQGALGAEVCINMPTTTRELQDRHNQASTKHSQPNAEQTKALQKEKLTQLLAPVSGTVQQLAIHSVGGVVTPAQALMVIVPDSPSVSAEVAIANLDIGFVNAGQEAQVKLETFSYTKYGTVKATVDKVAQDAVTDEKKGSFYPAILTLQQKDMDIDGKRVPISAGMNITAEVKTGKRRVIEYLLSPVQRAATESLRER